ncbi:hypothetical protein QL996_06930 [Planococcus sp. APC 4015]|nr:hypothetical protein [Planococcus sp. APC 4015]
MSTTDNADQPDHHGHDDGRETLTAGEAQRAQAGDATQSAPAMSQNNASDEDKIAGIVAQTRQDVAHMGHDRIVQVLTQRFEQTGIEVSETEIDDLARTVSDA